MDFTEWVDKVGGLDTAAALLNEKTRTVRSWYYLSRAPSARAAGRICAVSGGLVSYDGIYRPYNAHKAAPAVPQ